MLTQVTTTASGSTAKQITYTGTSSSVIYTVPPGKTFTGWFSSPSSSGSLSINGSTFTAMTGTATGPVVAMPLVLLAGTVVSGTGANVSLIGVEQ